jgi:sensor histidine kinase regulating citrate/malate metabolism
MKQNFDPIVKAEEKILQTAARRRESLAGRFPLVFGLTATFGLVSVLYGFEKIIDQIPIFVNNPWILLVVGLTLLLITGAAYRKLN